MPTTSNRGYTYPGSSGSDRIWEHFQALAAGIDTDVQSIIDTYVNFPIGRAAQATQQLNIADLALFAVILDDEDYDTHNFHSTTTNNTRVKPTVPGYYEFSGVVCFGGQTDYVGNDALIRLNGTTYYRGGGRMGGGGTNTHNVYAQATVPCNGSTDYVELVGRPDRSGNGTSQTVVNSFLASTLEWKWVRPL